ncbi:MULTISPECIES: hypothetical protein [Burkholderia]|uniref:Uncharacterized protein n=1 Tax=Burkholderia pyrrocinia TaxID=60550 RepID=A0A318IYF7_BURPY|nr:MULTISPECIES: hypothetical protein [Burkholderia]PXX39411.1 hypothetical protein NA66_1002540 [Burkholderia pyrrocinia]SFW20450.1 hypothetical protein SAMN03159384_00607 [Burkholderia sp. NFACC33-1]SFX18133.1 hypothetical protein SAMN03159408_00608 [Burkholderia sp. NFPP32]
MTITYEICGALSVLDNFRHRHAQQFAESIANPADVYFATDAATHSLVIRIRGALTDSEAESVEDTLEEFSQKWARTGAYSGACDTACRRFFQSALSNTLNYLRNLPTSMRS